MTGCALELVRESLTTPAASLPLGHEYRSHGGHIHVLAWPVLSPVATSGVQVTLCRMTTSTAGRTPRWSTHPLVTLILAQPGMAVRLLREHMDDGRGRCVTCRVGGHHGGQQWPCSIHHYAAEAATSAEEPDGET